MADTQAFALITGASSGIGKQLAYGLAQRGYHLILVARRGELLEQIGSDIKEIYMGTKVHSLVLDLSKPEAPRELYAKAFAISGNIEVLANNAGFGISGAFHDTNLEKQRDLFQLNMITPSELVHLFIPYFKERGKGYILQASSFSAFFPGGTYMSTYFASKAYSLSFSLAVNKELAGSGVSITALCPGAVLTEFFNEGFLNEKAQKQVRMIANSPEFVAESGLKALFKKKAYIIPGWQNKIASVAMQIAPKSWTLYFMEKMTRERVHSS